METQSVPRGQLRVSDADRDRAIAELSEHYQAGRLTVDELEDRTGQALQARTSQDLAVLFADLPRARATGPAPAEPHHAPVPWIAVVACGIVVAAAIVGGVRSGHPAVFGSVPLLLVLFVVRSLFRRRI